MSLADMTAEIAKRVGDDSGLDATLKFVLGDEGAILVDATKSPNEVSNDDTDADCTINVSLEDFQGILAGDLDPMTAFMMGKLKVEGNMGIAMKLQSVLG